MNLARDDDNYFIRADYRHNLVQATFDPTEDSRYWNPDRLLSAANYQYDVYAMAAKLASERNFKTLLDVGCGPPIKLDALMPVGMRICLIDQPNTAPHAKEILPEARFFRANLECEYPEINEVFDLVLCADVVEHLVNPNPCLEFLRCHLAPNGLLLISTPERDVLRGSTCTHSPHPMHVREWNQREFRKFLDSRGLQVIDYLLLPQQRTSPLKKTFGKLMSSLGKTPPWLSCQLAICQPRN